MRPGFETVERFSPALEFVKNPCCVTRVSGDGTFHVLRLASGVVYIELVISRGSGDGSCLHHYVRLWKCENRPPASRVLGLGTGEMCDAQISVYMLTKEEFC